MQSTHCKSSVFGMPRALMSLSKHRSAHVARPGTGHRGVGAPSCTARLLWLSASALGPWGCCPSWALRCPEGLDHCPVHPFWCWDEVSGSKRGPVGATDVEKTSRSSRTEEFLWARVTMARAAGRHAVQTAQAAKTSRSYACLQRMLKGVSELLFLNFWVLNLKANCFSNLSEIFSSRGSPNLSSSIIFFAKASPI